jgi:hypothetical protein
VDISNDLKIGVKELLNEYKSQQRVERGFRFLKSPEFLSDAIFDNDLIFNFSKNLFSVSFNINKYYSISF